MPHFSSENENLHTLDEIEANESKDKKKTHKFNIFSHTYDDGKGVDPDEVQISDNPTFINFFKLLGRKINQLLSVNIIMVVGNFPIFFFFLAMSGYLSVHTTSPQFVTFAPLRGAMLFHNSPAVSALWTVFSRQASLTVHTTADYIFLGLSALLLFTFGPVRVGVTYIIRNMFRGEPVFLIHDFFYAIKRNLRQAIVYGIIDLAIIGILVYDIVFFNLNYNISTFTNIIFYATLCLAVLYFFMRHYIYLMLVTFDLSIIKMFKNALIFTVLGIKRNIMVLLGTLLSLLIEYFFLSVFFPLGVIIPFVILPSLVVLIGIYGSFPKIKQIMIDPYYEETATKAGNDSE